MSSYKIPTGFSNLWPLPSGDWQVWGSALIAKLKKTEFSVPVGVCAVTFGSVPSGWKEITATGMPALATGGKWIVKGELNAAS